MRFQVVERYFLVHGFVPLVFFISGIHSKLSSLAHLRDITILLGARTIKFREKTLQLLMSFVHFPESLIWMHPIALK